MSKKVIVLLVSIFHFFAFSQEKIKVIGTVKDKYIVNDSIYFYSGILNKDYYENSFVNSFVSNSNFSLNMKISYPIRIYYILKSQKGNLSYAGYFFIDKSTTTIALDTEGKTNETDGITDLEYKNIFSPYILGKKPQMTMQMYMSDRAIEFDNKLLNYTKKNPNSYVALWFLIESLQINGITESFEETLNTFSKKIKSEKPWSVLNKEFQNIKIRVNKKFPKILLQNTDLKQELLTIPIAQYTLIDFWFSRCKPCLEEMPQWINMYNKYKDKGFNVIGISSDRTENVKPYWQKRIIEKGIPWKNYLDENAAFCTSEKIIQFPTNFLLNEKGEVIKKNIEPEDLEKLLSKNLK